MLRVSVAPGAAAPQPLQQYSAPVQPRHSHSAATAQPQRAATGKIEASWRESSHGAEKAMKKHKK